MSIPVNPTSIYKLLAPLFITPVSTAPLVSAKNLPQFSPQEGTSFDKSVAFWLCSAIASAYNFQDKNLIPLNIDPDTLSPLYQDSSASLPSVTSVSKILNTKSGTSNAVIGFVAPIEASDNVNRVVLSLRGTTTLSDFIADLNYQLTPVAFSKNPLVKAHTGVYQAYTKELSSNKPSLQAQIATALQKTLTNETTSELYITGHSLGAALATLATLDLALQYPNVSIILYHFASPRVGNDKFADLFNTLSNKRAGTLTSFRVVNSEDLITTLALPYIPGQANNYEHTNDGWSFSLNLDSLLTNHAIKTYTKYMAP